MAQKITALVGCQNGDCAAEVSYPLYMVAKWKDEPICKSCFEELPMREREKPGAAEDDLIEWSDLPPVTLADLTA